MKSLMEESSSIFKAIETAWQRAGKPQEFSVKILEHPETGFLGLTTVKSAKIALLFTESARQEAARSEPRNRESFAKSADRGQQPRQQRPERQPRQEQRQRQDFRRDGRHSGPRFEQRSEPRWQTEPRIAEQPQEIPHQRPEQAPRQHNQPREQQQRPSWNPEMVAAAQEWLKETLVLAGLPNIGAKSHVSQNYLKLIVDQAVSEDPRQEEMLLRSWSNLAFEALQDRFKQSLRGLRIVIEVRR